MKNALLALTQALPTLFQNITVSVALAGWPAAIAVSTLGIGLTAIAVCAIEAHSSTPIPIPAETAGVPQYPAN